MIRHKLVHETEPTVHEKELKIKAEELRRIQALLNIPDLSECPESQLERLGGKQDDCQYLFDVTFDDGSNLTWDLCSGKTNYYDNVVFTYNDIKEDLDCSYELDDIEIDCDTDIYIMRLEIIE